MGKDTSNYVRVNDEKQYADALQRWNRVADGIEMADAGPHGIVFHDHVLQTTFCHPPTPVRPQRSRLPLKGALQDTLSELENMMMDRHRKYGAGNIAKHGPVGILVRMDDKFQRLESGQKNFDDETLENTLDDIIGYALIWKLWIRKQWPGSE